MMTFFFEQNDELGQPLPQNEWSRVLLYSQVQASVILRQTRESGSDVWGLPYNGTSYPFLDRIIQEQRGFVSKAQAGRRLDMLRTEWMRKYMTTGGTDDRQFDYELFPTTVARNVKLELEMLEQRRWLDDKTQILNILVLLVNGELGRPRLEHVNIELQFSRGGGLYGTVNLMPLFLETFAEGSAGLINLGADACWVMMLTCNTGFLLRELWAAFVASTLDKHLSNGIVLVECFIMFLGWVNVAGFFMQSSAAKQAANQLQLVRDAVANVTDGTDINTIHETHAAELHTDVDNLIAIGEMWRTGLAWMTLVLIFRFFAAFRVQPRLAVVTNTLKAIIVDLAHFLVVFTPTFLAYAISGNIFFGRRLESFSTVQGSIGVCLRIAFENEYEWQSFSEEYFYSAAIWSWTYLVAMVMILLNMVLAIVLDIYNEVRAATDSTDTIFLFLAQVFAQLRNFKLWVRHKDLQSLFSETADEAAPVTVDDLLEAFPTMTAPQKDRLVTSCKLEMMFQANSELVANNLLKLGASIKLSLDDACVEVDNLNVAFDSLNEEPDPMSDVQAAEKEAQPGSSGPRTPRQATTPRETTPRRMIGESRPFPGVPSTPGGHFPPLLITSDSINLPSTLRNKEGDEPNWYVELRRRMEASGELMDVILSDLQTFHYWWNRMNRASIAGGASWLDDAGLPVL
jgi:hypothetical protein